MKKMFQFMGKWMTIFVLSIISAGLLSDGFTEDSSKSKPKKEQR